MDIPQVINTQDSSVGEMGQAYLATGKAVALRRWDENAGESSELHSREYETVGYLISGRMEVEIDGQPATLLLVPAVRVMTGQRFDKCGFSVVDMSSGTDDRHVNSMPT